MTRGERWGPCPHCSAEGWWTPSTHIGGHPLYQHDRPQGGVCLRADPRTFRVLDGDDSNVLGGDVTISNVYIRAYGALLPGEKRPTDLAIGESTRKRYALSGQKPTVYRILRVS